MGVLVGDGDDTGDSALAPAWPLPEKTVVKPLLCGVGLRLFPALISASSSELSPVGDIMLKDLVPSVPAMRESLMAHGTVPRQSPLPAAGARSSLRSAAPRRSQRAAGAEGPAGRARCHPAPAETPQSRDRR